MRLVQHVDGTQPFERLPARLAHRHPDAVRSGDQSARRRADANARCADVDDRACGRHGDDAEPGVAAIEAPFGTEWVSTMLDVLVLTCCTEPSTLTVQSEPPLTASAIGGLVRVIGEPSEISFVGSRACNCAE